VVRRERQNPCDSSVKIRVHPWLEEQLGIRGWKPARHPWLKTRPASVAQNPPGSRSHSSHYSGPSVVTSCHFIAFRIGSILSTIKPSWKTRTVPVDCETAMAIAPVDLEISAAAQ
jgi:hypothetical protein